MSIKRNASEHRIYRLMECLPGILLAAAWPCLVHLDHVRTHLEQESWYPAREYADDYFMHIRSIACLILAGWMLAMMVLGLIRSGTFHAPRRMKILLASVGAFLLLTLISSLCSPFRRYAFAGIPESYETWPVLCAYAVIFFYTAFLMRGEAERKLLAGAVSAGACIQGLIGITQFLGHDFWATSFGRTLLVLGSGRDPAALQFEADQKNRVYLSFYNPNYAAVYILLVLPFAIEGIRRSAAALREKKSEAPKARKARYTLLGGAAYLCFYIATAFLLLVSLAGTGSRTGLFLLLVLGPCFYALRVSSSKGWKWIVPGVVVCAVIFVLTADTSFPSGSIVRRSLNDLFPEPVAGTLRGIDVEDDSATLRFDDQSLRFSIESTEKGMRLYVFDADTDQPLHLVREKDGNRFYVRDKNLRIPKKRVMVEAFVEGPAEDPEGRTAHLIIWYRIKVPIHFLIGEEGNLLLLNNVGRPAAVRQAEKALPIEDERALTGRVYVWNRTLPLIGKHLLLGYGQEAFPFVFPHDDYLARANVNGSIMEDIITRPHSMYLQILFCAGIPGAACLLIAAASLAAGTYRGDKKVTPDHAPRRMASVRNAAAFAAILFLAAGLLNDSTVAVTPIFCLIVGMLA